MQQYFSINVLQYFHLERVSKKNPKSYTIPINFNLAKAKSRISILFFKYHEKKYTKFQAQFEFDKLWDGRKTKPTLKLSHLPKGMTSRVFKIQNLRQSVCSNSTFATLKNSLFVTLKYFVHATAESSVSATL